MCIYSDSVVTPCVMQNPQTHLFNIDNDDNHHHAIINHMDYYYYVIIAMLGRSDFHRCMQ